MIPKIAYFYWSKGTPLSYLRYLTVKTFRKLHPDWTINFCHSSAGICKKWDGGESQEFLSTNSKDVDYISMLADLNVNIIDYTKHNDKAPNFISDFFRWDILSQTGGWYFDVDQIFIKNIDSLCTHDFVVDGSPSSFVGVVGAEKNSEITKYINNMIITRYNPSFYNCIGPWLLNQLLHNPGDHTLKTMLKQHNTLLAPRDMFYPVHPDNINDLFEKTIEVPENSYCIHWFGGHPTSQKYNKLITEDNTIKNTITKYVDNILNVKPVKISFGIIVVNGEPWIKPLLESLYKHAHSICIAEGATKTWKETNKFITPRSTDNTLNIIKNFPDPENKIKVCASPDFYNEKLEQCNAWLDLVPKDTDYVWEIDTDEFYKDDDICLMKNMLSVHKYTYVEFQVFNFFKNMDYIGTGGDGWGYDTPFPRIFKYYPNCKWSNHRPPTILDENGVDYRQLFPLTGNNNPVKMYHYSYVTEKQVEEKIKYYTKAFGRDYYNEWYLPYYKQWTPQNRIKLEKTYSAHPSRPHGITKRFTQEHPAIINEYFNTKNKDITIRLDDFPTGIRPLLPNIDPLVEILQRFCHHFEKVKLGIVPKLLTQEYFNKIKHLKFEPCIHGYDHHYYNYSVILKNDPYNKNTVVQGFNEFENNTIKEITSKLTEARDILEQKFGISVTSYIAPCNTLDKNTLEVLNNLNLVPMNESDFYGKVFELEFLRPAKIATFHLTWEYDELTWKEKDKEQWSLRLERLKNENLV